MNDTTLKIIFVGDCGVGNTSIINRYIKDSFDPNSPSSRGASYASKKIVIEEYDLSLQLDLWDTGGGQEKYRAMKKIYYPGTSICILVYDITSRVSFESIKTFWFGNVKEYGGNNIEFGIAGNKSDLYEEEKVNEKEAKEFAKSINAIFHLTSCKFSMGINDLIEECVIKYLKGHNDKVRKIEKAKKSN